MTWREIKVVDQRKDFVRAYQDKLCSFSTLCQQFNISRKTGYKWVRRFLNYGLEGLKDISRAPHRQSSAVDEDMVQVIINIRLCFPKLGPKKILSLLQDHYSFSNLPSASTIGNILDRADLVDERQYRRRVPWTPTPPPNPIECNDTWCGDFKGYFLLSDGYKCSPFTVTDLHSRFLIECTCLKKNDEECVWNCLTAAFRQYGLPNNFKTDNGVPFASIGVRRLSKLSVKLIKSGVNPIFIEPGKPQQNGRHERMHRTLNEEACRPPSHSMAEQMARFDEFQEFYNYTRPHESLGQRSPGAVYQPSTRQWSGVLKSPEYDDACTIRKVLSGGTVKLNGKRIFISEALIGEPIALREEHEGVAVYYGPLLLGYLDKECKLQKLRKPVAIQ